MKISNNALNFLLAQYRAIFKRAYVKGIASAVLLTAGLAAGQAQAVQTAFSDPKLLPDSGDTIVITSTGSATNANEYKNISITSGTYDKFNGELIISGGTAGTNANKNVISANRTETKISGKGTLTIDVAQANSSSEGLTITGNGANVTTDIGSIAVKNGLLNLQDKTAGAGSGSLFIGADNITIGTETANTQAVVTLTSTESATSVTLGNAANSTTGESGSNITVNGNGKLTLKGTSSASIKGASLSLTNGAVMLTDTGSGNKIESENFSIDNKSFKVISGSGTVKETFTGKTGDIYGNVAIGGSSTWVLSNQDKLDPVTEEVITEANVTVHKDANVQLTGTLSISGGTLTVNEDAKLYATTNAGTGTSGSIIVTKSGDESGTLVINGSTLTKFLTGKDGTTQLKYQAIEADGTNKYKLGTETDAKSGSVILSDGILEITGTSSNKSFDLAGLSFKAQDGSSTGAANTIVLDSGTSVTQGNTILGDYLTVSSKLKDSSSNALAASSKLLVKATNLTLGNTTTAVSEALGFSGAYTQNLTVLAPSGDEFVLKSEVNLDVTTGSGDTGAINGPMTIATGGTLNALHGTFETNAALTVSGGTLSVTNAALADGTHMDTKLILKGDLNLIAGTANGIVSVDGQNLDEASTILDIRDATVNVTSGSNNPVAVKVSNGGLLLATSTNLHDLFDVQSNKSGAGVFISGGTVEITEGAVELNQNQLTSDAAVASSQIVFSNSATSVGTFKVDGSLTINDVTGLDIGDSSAIIADTLSLYGKKASDGKYGEAKLSKGKFLAQSTLQAANKTDTINISGAKVFLGDFNELKDSEDKPYYEAVSDTGSIDAKLTLSATGSELTVQNGSWTGQSVTVTAGDLNVGLSGAQAGFDGTGVKHDVNDDAIGASLKLDSLTLGAAGTANIADVGTLDTTTLSVANSASGAFTVAGVANVAGKYTPESTSEGTTTPASFGVTLTGGEGSIKVTQGGALTFGEDATKAITLDPAADANDKDAVTVNAAAFGSKIFSVDAGGKITFSFSENQTFSADALADMRTKLFTDLNADNLVAGTISLGNAQLAGVKADTDGAYNWSDLEKYSDVADFTTEDIRQSVVKGIASTDNVRGHFGALKAENMNTGNQISIVGDTSLNNADAQNGVFALGNNGAVLGLNITEPSLVQLNNGGQIGQITLSADSTLAINHDKTITAPDDTLIQSIKGTGTAEFNLGKSIIAENSDMGNLVTNVGSDVTFKGTLTVGSTDDVETVLAGTSNTFEGEATFKNNTYIEGAATFQDGVTFNSNKTGIYANTAVSGGAIFANAGSDQSIEIGGNSTFTADSIELSGTGIHFVVGEEDYVEDGQTHEGSTGYLQADAFKLAGNTLVVDPSYERETSIAYVKNFTDGDSKEDAGIFSGKLIAGQNAALIVGTSKDVYDDAMAVIKGYQNSRGALIEDEVGSLVYIGDQLTAKDDSRIIIDSQRTQEQIFGSKDGTIKGALKDGSYQATYQNGSQKIDADLFLGVNTVMVVSDNILDKKDNVAVHFQSNDAYIMAEKAEGKEHAAKIVLDGNGFLDSRDVTLFTDTGSASTNEDGVKVLGDQDIRVETLNGVMYFMLNAGKEVTGGKLNLDTTKIDTAFLGATDESRNLLFAYTSQTANWEEYFDEANLAKDDTDDTKIQREQLHGDVASNTIANYDATQTNGVALTQAALDSGEFQPEDFIAVPLLDEDGKQITDKETGKALGTVYHRAYNDLLEAIARNTNGAATDSAALQGVFGGAAQAALLAARTSQEAVAGRTGVGASSSALTFADNGQGAGLWVNPIYVSQDSDGFEVGNKDYGVDIDLYGVALGGDYTLANGVRVGAFFNVGSGEADGNGQASGVSNDFDYYGIGLYAGYSVGQFSIVGDVSYSVVDSEIDASTAVGKITSSFDTDNLSVGVTGQYEFDFNGTLVTPHVGLRYSALSVDDYSFKAADYTQGGDASIDDANVFSIPVGVTVAKEFAFNTWTVKPSLDVTVQGNFGDDELDSTAEWDNVAWQSNYSSEFIDNFTYGATLGVAAKTGSFSAGIGLGYQGSSNTDEFSATANARFVF